MEIVIENNKCIHGGEQTICKRCEAKRLFPSIMSLIWKETNEQHIRRYHDGKYERKQANKNIIIGSIPPQQLVLPLEQFGKIGICY